MYQFIKQIGWKFAVGERSSGKQGKEGGPALHESYSEQAGKYCLRLKNIFCIIYSTVSQYIDSQLYWN